MVSGVQFEHCSVISKKDCWIAPAEPEWEPTGNPEYHATTLQLKIQSEKLNSYTIVDLQHVIHDWTLHQCIMLRVAIQLAYLLIGIADKKS